MPHESDITLSKKHHTLYNVYRIKFNLINIIIIDTIALLV